MKKARTTRFRRNENLEVLLVELNELLAEAESEVERRLQKPKYPAVFVVGAHLWMVQHGIAHRHLTAYDNTGYDVNASYGMHWRAFEYFQEKVQWINLGGGAGTNNDGEDGLSKFKKGWCNTEKEVFICGRVFDKERYCQLSKGYRESQYFPLYRQGEFALLEKVERTVEATLTAPRWPVVFIIGAPKAELPLLRSGLQLHTNLHTPQISLRDSMLHHTLARKFSA